MDNSLLSRISSATDAMTRLNRVNPVTRGTGDTLQSDATSSSSVDKSTVPVRIGEDSLFALEQHIPVQILQNPQLLKAEWAWKLLILQQLSMEASLAAMFTNEPETGAKQGLGARQDPSAKQNPSVNKGQDELNAGTLAGTDASTEEADGIRSAVNPEIRYIPQEMHAGEQAQIAGGTREVEAGAKAEGRSATAAPSEPSATGEGRASIAGAGRLPNEAGSVQANSSQQTLQSTMTTSENSAVPAHMLQNDAEAAISQLWQLLSSVASQAAKGSSQVQMNLRTDPPVLPFTSMNQDTIALAQNPADSNRIERWVAQDRLLAGVLDNPYERLGGGLFFTPPAANSATPPYQAVKWQAQRQTRIGTAGRLIHRLRLEMEVRGQPLTCIVTAQRPQLLVHFVSEDTKLLSHLKQGEAVVTEPLRACGWELIGWTAGQGAENEAVESE